MADSTYAIAYLEETLGKRIDGASDGAVHRWASDKLCDLGAERSLPLVQKWLSKVYDAGRAQQEMNFCEARVAAIRRDSSQIRSLAFVLRSDPTPPNTRLVGWALARLADLRDPGADREIVEFAARIRALHPGREADTLYGGVIQQADVLVDKIRERRQLVY